MKPDRDRETIDSAILQEIVEGTASATGEAFFDELVRHLSRAMETKCAWVTEWHEKERRLRALSFWVEDRLHLNFEYCVEGTPCAPVVDERRLVHIPDRVIELYAEDEMLEPLGAVSYMGVPLLDTDGSLLGHLAVLHDAPMPEDERKETVFNIFANRASAELRRIRRDRDIREREQKLSRLIDSAMDAIVELDGALQVTSVNRAAERLFARRGDELVGASLDTLLTRGSCGKVVYLTRDLERQPEGRQSTWVPDGLEVVGSGESNVPAEASLSRFEMAGRPFFSLILRNVNERLVAEARIRSLMNETALLRAELEALQGFDEIVGESPALRRLLADVERVAASNTTVLVVGETGTGKELIARAIHQRSPRKDGPLVTVNCAAIAAGLQESEFFGHERGAFTGATQSRDGRFKLADGGTIFLDEVGELPLDLQAKLLRVLQEGEIQPVGSSRTIRVDVRVVAATNRDLEKMAEEGTFRTDLLYRLNVFPLHVPPLRERGDDVILLATSFAERLARSRGRTAVRFTPDDVARLTSYDWPGNVRELQNVIERAYITSPDGRHLNLDRGLPESAAAASRSEADSVPSVEDEDRILTARELVDLERQNTVRALEAADWKISGKGGAAELLGLKPNTLSSRMRSLGIERPR